MEEAPERELKRLRGDDAVTSAAAEAWDPQYTYLSIEDALKVPGVRVCLFAVVSEIGAAVRSRGTDYTLTLRIVDQSRTAGISVTFFADNTALLPCVKSSGDVISLHNVMITMHGEFFVTFNKKFSSFALFGSQVSAECSPYQTSMKYHGSKHDKELLTQMRTWLAYNPLGLKDPELQLRSLKSDSTFDLVCKVFHVHENNGKWIFHVWDGTDTPAAEFQTMMYDSRNAKMVHRLPMASFPSNVTDVAVKAPYITLMQSLTHYEVTHKFKTLVRVVGAYPYRHREAHVLSTGKYCMRLTLEDPTARIHAYVHKDDMVKFFGGFLKEEVIIKKMNKLLGNPELEDSEEGAPLTRNPPWIWCCLKSYRLDKHDPWGSRRYRIFATEIKD